MLSRWFFLLIIGATALGATGCGEQKPRPNIILVVLDTVRGDFDQQQAKARPHLTALAAEGTVFSNAWATAPWTVPSHASMFTGKLASGHHCTHQNPKLDTGQSTLAEQLTAAGYATGAFFSNPWLASRTTGLLRGFSDIQEAPVKGGIAGDPGTWRGDQGGRASVTHLRRWLKKQEGEAPFFAFVNLLEAHLPYDPAPQIRRALLPARGIEDVTGQWGMEYQSGRYEFDDVDWQRLRELYWGDVATVDHLLSGIISTLQEFGLAEDTILIVCSDHGENLGDHQMVDHQFSLHETLLSVPLIIRAPGYLPASERRDPVMLSDLYATIREFAQIKGDLPEHSRSLLAEPAAASRPLVAEYATPQRHLVNSLQQINPNLDRSKVERSLRSVRVGEVRLTLGSDGEVQLHDMQADPQQENNLAAARPADVKALRILLQQELSVYQPGGRSEVELDEATREQLRSLGYVR